jgi:hypothetical protein
VKDQWKKALFQPPAPNVHRAEIKLNWDQIKEDEIDRTRSMHGGYEYKILVGKIGGKRPLGIYRRRLKGSVMF